jgi:hypothetical protein
MKTVRVMLAGWLFIGLALWAVPVSQVLAQGVKTKSTGVGTDERAAARDGYAVRFEFAEVAGPYLANVAVVITDAGGGKVVEVVSDGPWLLADLGPGQYRVVATAPNGQKQGASFTVEAGQKTVVRLAWR